LHEVPSACSCRLLCLLHLMEPSCIGATCLHNVIGLLHLLLCGLGIFCIFIGLFHRHFLLSSGYASGKKCAKQRDLKRKRNGVGKCYPSREGSIGNSCKGRPGYRQIGFAALIVLVLILDCSDPDATDKAAQGRGAPQASPDQCAAVFVRRLGVRRPWAAFD